MAVYRRQCHRDYQALIAHGRARKRLWLPDERLRDLLKLQDELREQLKTPLVPAPPAGR